jgi:hypothetical protein
MSHSDVTPMSDTSACSATKQLAMYNSICARDPNTSSQCVQQMVRHCEANVHHPQYLDKQSQLFQCYQKNCPRGDRKCMSECADKYER